MNSTLQRSLPLLSSSVHRFAPPHCPSSLSKSRLQPQSTLLSARYFSLEIPDSDASLREIITAAGSKLTVIDWSATWCAPCRRITPVIEQMADSAEYKDKVVFVKADVDELAEASQLAGVQSVPTFHFLKNGKMLHKFAGADEAQLKEAIENFK